LVQTFAVKAAKAVICLTEDCTMAPVRLVSALALTIGLGACTSPVPDATRNLPIDETTGRAVVVVPGDSAVAVGASYSLVAPQYDVTAVNVAVPESLRVSEANMYYPVADIVWRGEPRGNRHDQVKAIFEQAFAAGTSSLDSGRPVVVDVVVDRFHCLTEKARYTIGGVHSLKFTLSVRDAATGELLDGPRLVVADIKASGGAIAVQEEADGITQRIVILDRLRDVALRELTRPLAVPVPKDGPVALADGMVAVSRGTFDPTEIVN
jgi:hypothetical protein